MTLLELWERMNMYSKDMIVGIMLSVGKPEIQIIRDDNSNIGYRVRLMVKLRGREKFVEAVKERFFNTK